MRAALLILFVIAGGASSISADTVMDLSPADRLRITTEDRRREFALQGVRQDTLVVLEKGSESHSGIAISDIEALDIRVPSTRGRGAARGFAVGFFAGFMSGAVIGYLAGDDDNPCSGQELCLWPPTREEGATLGAFFFGVGGAILGTLIGAAHPGTYWQPVELPVNIRLRPDRAELSWTVLRGGSLRLPF